jgi:hypothetical protein
MGRVVALVGLVGLAITQPVLDLMGQNPEFFVAGRYTGAQIVEFGVLVAVVPALAVAGVFLLANLVDRRAGDVAYSLLLAGRRRWPALPRWKTRFPARLSLTALRPTAAR